MTHICVSKLTIIGSDNGLSPARRQAIIWTKAGILLIRTLGTNFSEILSEIRTFSFKKMHLKMSSAKWRPFCLGFNVLRHLLLTMLARRPPGILLVLKSKSNRNLACLYHIYVNHPFAVTRIEYKVRKDSPHVGCEIRLIIVINLEVTNYCLSMMRTKLLVLRPRKYIEGLDDLALNYTGDEDSFI